MNEYQSTTGECIVIHGACRAIDIRQGLCAVNYTRMVAMDNGAEFEMTAATMAFSISVLLPGGEPHLERQKPANLECHRSHRLNLAKIDSSSFLFITKLNDISSS